MKPYLLFRLAIIKCRGLIENVKKYSTPMISISGPVRPTVENSVSHLRLWNVPIFQCERDIRNIIEAALQNSGFQVREVEVTLMRVLKTVSRNKKQQVGGNSGQSPHCGGSATVNGKIAFGSEDNIRFCLNEKQLFRAEVSTQVNPQLPESSRKPVQTLFCKLFYYSHSHEHPFSMTSLLELLQRRLQGSTRLITHLVTMRRPGRDIKIRNVLSTDFMIECSTPEAAAWIRSEIHDSTYRCCDDIDCIQIMTSYYTTDGSSTSYKPILLNDNPQRRIDNSRAVSAALTPPPFMIPPDIQKLAESACTLACKFGNIPEEQVPYILLGALAFQEQVEALKSGFH